LSSTVALFVVLANLGVKRPFEPIQRTRLNVRQAYAPVVITSIMWPGVGCTRPFIIDMLGGAGDDGMDTNQPGPHVQALVSAQLLCALRLVKQ